MYIPGIAVFRYAVVGGKKCLLDETVPEYPVNVYFCEDPVKTECCVVDGQGSCCEPKQSVTR